MIVTELEIVGTNFGPEESCSYCSVIFAAIAVFNHSSCREILSLQNYLFVSMIECIVTEWLRQ